MRSHWLAAFILIVAATGCKQVPRADAPDGGRLPRGVAREQAADVHVALGRSLEADGDLEKAMTAYREALRRDPKRAEAHLRMAVVLDRLGRFSESAPHYDAALKASPGDPEVFCDRGYSLALQGRDAEAEATLRQAIAKQPDLARAHNNLGLLLGRKGKADESLAEFRKAGCAEPDAHLNLAFALGQSHRWDDAKAHVAIARSLGADAPAVEEAAAGLQGLIARGEGAISDPAVRTAGASGADLK